MRPKAAKRTLLAAPAIALACCAILFLLFARDEPEPAAVPDRPVTPKLTRPARKSAARSDLAKKMVAKTAAAKATKVKPFGCLKKSEYDETSGILQLEVDIDCDGVADQCLVKQLNEYGEPVRTVTYRDCTIQNRTCTEIEYNKYGEEIAYYYDSDCDGKVDSCIHLIRNRHGDIVEETFDKNCDGVLAEGDWHHCSSYTYDQDGLISTQKGDRCDGKPEYCASYEYDFDAGTQRSIFDEDCDGTVDSCQVMVYRDGYESPNTFYENNCDGTWKSCNIQGDVDWVVSTISDPEECVKKFAEFVNENHAAN